MDLKEITLSWLTKVKHSPLQKELAEKRLAICISCPHKKEFIKNKTWLLMCGHCNCPLTAKVYSPNYNACPENKWQDVELEFFTKIKNVKKTLI